MRKPPISIHLARDLITKRIIGADRAIHLPGNGRYQCLDENCHRDLTVARSKNGRMYFRHFRKGGDGKCAFLGKNSNSPHDAAQRLLKAVLTEALQRRAPLPQFQFHTPKGIESVFPFMLGSVMATEWTCPTTGRRADLAVLNENNKPILLIEVFHTHAVDRNKRHDLSGYWWIQVGAAEVLANPFKLNILDHGNLPYEFEVLGHQGDLFSEECAPRLQSEYAVLDTLPVKFSRISKYSTTGSLHGNTNTGI